MACAGSDLVYVLKQKPHGTFERLGDDLWYSYNEEITPAEQVFWCGSAPSLIGGRTLYVLSNTLPALLGYDRSGVGEAVIPGEGMPLRDDYALSLMRSHGDLVIKFPIVLPSVRRRLCVTGGLLLPPVLLLTSCLGVAPSETGTAADALLPVMALRSVLSTAILPAALTRVHHRLERDAAELRAQARALSSGASSIDAAVEAGADPQIAAKRAAIAARRLAAAESRRPLKADCSRPCGGCPCPGGLHGVLLILEAVEEELRLPAASAASAQLMRAVSTVLPQLVWHEVHLVRGVTSPLLDDEAALVEEATLLVLQAERAPACQVPRQFPPPPPLPPPRWYEVAWAPGVRIRNCPSCDSGAVVGHLRSGARFKGRIRKGKGSETSWVQLADGRGWVQCALPKTLPAAGSAVAIDADAPPSFVRELDNGGAGWAGESEDDGSTEEDDCGRVERTSRDQQWWASGLDDARALLAEEGPKQALMRCHCGGGVVIAIDGACSLLGQPCVPRGRSPRAAHATSTVPSRGWPHLLPYLISPSPPPARGSTSPRTQGDAVVQMEAPPSWRRLRGSLIACGLPDSTLGFAAVGLPAGAVVAVLPGQHGTLRPSLGSSTPVKLSAAKVIETEQRNLAGGFEPACSAHCLTPHNSRCAYSIAGSPIHTLAQAVRSA